MHLEPHLWKSIMLSRVTLEQSGHCMKSKIRHLMSILCKSTKNLEHILMLIFDKNAKSEAWFFLHLLYININFVNISQCNNNAMISSSLFYLPLDRDLITFFLMLLLINLITSGSLRVDHMGAVIGWLCLQEASESRETHLVQELPYNWSCYYPLEVWVPWNDCLLT